MGIPLYSVVEHYGHPDGGRLLHRGLPGDQVVAPGAGPASG